MQPRRSDGWSTPGHRLELSFKGKGALTVVFNAGMSGGMQVRCGAGPGRAHAQTVRFERAGFGGSDVGPSPRTARRLATELRAALVKAGVSLPVVLVGHSAGSFFPVVYPALFLKDVRALVLVDAATDDAHDDMRDISPALWAKRSDPTPWESAGAKAPPG